MNLANPPTTISDQHISQRIESNSTSTAACNRGDDAIVVHFENAVVGAEEKIVTVGTHA